MSGRTTPEDARSTADAATGHGKFFYNGQSFMYLAKLKAFLEKVKGDISLQQKLKAATDTQALNAVDREQRFSISDDRLSSTGSHHSEISRAGLKSVNKGW